MTDTTAEMTAPAPRYDPKVVTALRRFAISISVFNILGYTLLGFEQPWTWPLFALATAYAVEIVLEVVAARAEGRTERFRGNGVRGVVEFLFPAHITALALNMLTYVNDRVWVMLFGVIVAVGAKWVLRAPVRGRLRHFMNPSNFGIAVILLLFPWASIAPPYHFTEYVSGPLDWLIPLVIIMTGTLLNAKLTGRMWLIMAWLVGFVLQAVLRGLIFDTAIPGALGMMTGVAFVLFTNYMITDPGTTPSKPVAQMAFGGGVALMYGVLTALGIAYGIFFATAAVCLVRGGYLWWIDISARRGLSLAPAPPTADTDSPVAALAGPGATPGTEKEAIAA
ncbi:enediyne biosynthesis protein UnbU [Streptomyces clavuligerus]|uniref:Enediyne biosynthesis protein UnbU n=1 Tax=Streptomyces clavuligerus TaxID=1901 RepID=B5H1E0_STRCL|nr:enediyne biosynthesis protein UnbU [Streptomyces clavuligerus]EDY52386.1 UnbU [Streptomyces clavuligerus]EFG04833.1 Enediyne biosynthesis protein UnbU [Streptomyces clavuligerus]MBY6306721.1 enediyne biosynthesis protein [Streptomyces clavuligerus]QCS10671.1 enediyne biosynthesis protein [Streptomyces clavuligerus]QPJ97292.1 enediyne biosynthesis protein [Streptomyces clavuligerus]